MTHHVTLTNGEAILGIIEVPEEVPGIPDLHTEVWKQYGRLMNSLEEQGVEYMDDDVLVERFAKWLGSNRIPARVEKVILVDVRGIPEAG
jgi:hypothetical protein